MGYLRGVLFLIWVVFWLLLLGVIFLPTLFMGLAAVKIPMKIWVKLTSFGVRHICGIKVRIEGIENIPKGGALLASKHQSMFDVIIPWQLFSFPALILKSELSRIPIFGWYVMKLKNVAINRKDGAKALRKMMKDCAALAKQNRQILIFPEGTRVKPGTSAPYKPGVAGLYKEMQVPCVPIALNSGLCWPKSGLNFQPGTITVRILPAIAPGLDKKTFMQQLQTSIETASLELNSGEYTSMGK
ncbi:MAG: 1-acyl-sn-glycerol-3-phosphate acyltransferase [Robiginitomaculum sp.]|nr:1-acyl-sn-glycerol-3-phosphate acyltransferase [Robiginitomaculum sp.]